MTGYFDKRKKQKLYQQWVEKSGLPPESIPGDVEQKGDLDEPMGEKFGARRPGNRDGITLHLTVRQLLYLLLVIVAWLSITVILATLVVQSC